MLKKLRGAGSLHIKITVTLKRYDVDIKKVKLNLFNEITLLLSILSTFDPKSSYKIVLTLLDIYNLDITLLALLKIANAFGSNGPNT